jgi:predicted porin
MKKQLLAAAVATAIAVPMAASADVTVYGKLHYSIDSIDYEDSLSGSIPGTGNDSLPAGYDGSAVNSHSSRFGIKGSEDLGNGLSALFQMEFGIDGEDLGRVRNNRNTYVALASSWGVVGIGQVDTPYKSSTSSLELFGDNIGDYNQLYFDDIRTNDAVFYMSPNWNGFSFVAGLVLPSSSLDSDGVEATSVAAKYENGPFFASLAYEAISGEYVDDIYATVTNNDSDYDKWRLGLGYTANGFHLGFIYEARDLDDLDVINPALDNDGDSWQLSGSYTAGNNTFKIAYGEVEDMVRSSGMGFQVDGEQWTVGVDHKMSKRTKLYATYSDFDNDAADMDWDAFSLGIVHKF